MEIEMIKCSNGSIHRHETIAESKACWATKMTTETQRVVPATPAVPMATEPQKKFIKDLLAGRDWQGHLPFTATVAAEFVAIGTTTKHDAHRLIDELLDTPKIPATKFVGDLEDGRYAVEIDGKLRFFHVTHGKKNDKLYVKERTGDNVTKLCAGLKYATVITAVKAAGPLEAMKVYGQKIGRCGCCGKALTDETSRALGIGPVCRKSYGI